MLLLLLPHLSRDLFAFGLIVFTSFVFHVLADRKLESNGKHEVKLIAVSFREKKNLTEKKGRKREHREIFNERNLWKFVFVHCFVVFVLPIRQLQKLLNRLLAL